MNLFDFWQALPGSSFAQNALWMSLLASIACGVVGSYVVVRRITYIAAAIAHSVLAGLGAARYLQAVYGWTYCTPQAGALVAAILSALIIGWAARVSEREDSVIGAVWSLGMATGILFIYKTPGYSENLMSYLFGNILLVSPSDLWITAALDAAILAVAGLFHVRLQAICFDEEFARLRGIRVSLYYNVLLLLTAVTVVLLAMVVGLVMVIALLTLPAAIAGRFAGSLAQMMAGAAVLCLFFNLAGLTLSYTPDLPPGSVIILLSGAAYFAVLGAGAVRNSWKRRENTSPLGNEQCDI